MEYLMVCFSLIFHCEETSIKIVVLTATFYAPTNGFPAPKLADVIIPLSNLSPSLPNFFTIADDLGATSNVSLPGDSIEAFVEVFCSGNAAEEFWYLSMSILS
jgi:hypothetical protein